MTGKARARGAGAEGLNLLKQSFKEFNTHNCPSMAAAPAYCTIFSLPPLLVVIVIIAGAALDPDTERYGQGIRPDEDAVHVVDESRQVPLPRSEPAS